MGGRWEDCVWGETEWIDGGRTVGRWKVWKVDGMGGLEREEGRYQKGGYFSCLSGRQWVRQKNSVA